MKLVKLSRSDFDKFAKTNQYRSFYQTSAYGDLMLGQGFNSIYIGLKNKNNSIVAASLFLYKNIKGNKKFAYAPRGFLLDYNDKRILKEFTAKIKGYFRGNNFVFIKIDPAVIFKEHNPDGSIKTNGIDNSEVLKELLKDGYKHLGFTSFLEGLKPRWNVRLKIEGSSENTFKNFHPDVQEKIINAHKKGFEVYKGTEKDLEKFFFFVKNKNSSRNIDYYKSYFNTFGKKDMFELWFVKMNTNLLLENERLIYENEININNELSKLVLQPRDDKEEIIEKKMKSDEKLARYKNSLISATSFAAKYPQGRTVAAQAIIKYENEIFFLIDGYNIELKGSNPDYLLKWMIIDKYIKEGYQYFNLNGTTSQYNNKNSKFYNLYDYKTKMGGSVIEYLGEFDYIIRKSTYKNIKSLLLFKKMITKAKE